AELCREDFLQQVVNAMLQSPCRCEGKALFVLGPSAAGKSTALSANLLEVPPGAMTVDGSVIRDTSQSWDKARSLAKAKGLAGFSDYFEGYFKPSMDKLKKKILDDAIRRAANLIIPDTGSNFAATKAKIQRLREAGYHLTFAAVFGDAEVLLSRGRARATEDGKQFTGRNWQKSVQAILDLQEYLELEGLIVQSGPILVMDNSTASMRVMSIAELKRYLEKAQAAPEMLTRRLGCCSGCWRFF
ncbi:unnamed protein product, partial [Symbiodinium pilosum]